VTRPTRDDDVEPSALVDLPAAPARGLEDLLASRGLGHGC